MRSRFIVGALALFIVALAIVGTRYIGTRDELKTTADSHTALALKGMVQSRDGSPLVAATVCAYGDGIANRLARYCAATNPGGVYRLELEVGRYSVTASADLHASSTAPLEITDGDRQLSFTLERQAPTIAGHVKSAAGVSLASATVTIYRDDKAVTNVITAGDGTFRAWTPPGSLTVSAAATGYGAALIRTVAPSLDLELTLYPGNSVAGRVLTEGTSQPVAGVGVVASHRADRIISNVNDERVVTDDEGRFRFENLGAGNWYLTAADKNVWGMSVTPIAVTLGASIDDVTLFVRPARAVSGKFSISGSEDPCPQGQLQLIPAAVMEAAASNGGKLSADESNDTHIFIARTSEDGSVEFTAVPYGTYRLGALCEEHRLVDGPTTLTVDGDKKELLRWQFERGGEVVVTVVDESGKPIPNTPVRLAPVSARQSPEPQLVLMQRQGMTDNAGECHFGGLVAGPYEVNARHPALNGRDRSARSIDVGERGVTSVRVTLSGSSTILIRAHSSAGAPLSRMLFFAANASGTRYEARSLGDGHFLLGPLAEDSYYVYAYDNKNAKIPLNGGRAILATGAERLDLDFNYDEPRAYVEGVVLDGNGNPMPETLVRAISTTLDANDEFYSNIQVATHGSQELMTATDGRFRLGGLDPNGVYDIYVDHRDGLKDIRRGVTPGRFLSIALPTPAAVEGSVGDANGRPLEEFDVLVETAENGTNQARVFRAAHGRFKIDNVFPGRVRVTVTDAERDLYVARELAMTPGSIARLSLTATAPRASGE